MVDIVCFLFYSILFYSLCSSIYLLIISAVKHRTEAVNEILELIKSPVLCYKSVLPILKIKNYKLVIDLLSREDKKNVSKFFVDNLLQSEDKVCYSLF